MKESNLRKQHRNLGICLALLILLQTGTGVLLTLNDVSTGPAHAHGDIAAPSANPAKAEKNVTAEIDGLDCFSLIHHSGGTIGTIYRLVVGIGLLWMAVSGSMIYFKIRARTKRT